MASPSDSNELGLLRRLRVGMGAVARDGGPGPGGGKGPGPQAQGAASGSPGGGPGPANTNPPGQGNSNGRGPGGEDRPPGKGKGNRPTAITPAVAGAAAAAPSAAEESQTQAPGPAGPAATPPSPPGPPKGPPGPPQPPGQTTSTTTSSTPTSATSTISSTTQTSTTAATTAATANTDRPTVLPFLTSDSATTEVVAPTQTTAATGVATTSDAMTEVFPTGVATVNSDVQMTPGKIAGITVGTMAAFFLAIVAVHFFFRWKRSRLPEFDMLKTKANNRASSRWRWTQMSRSSRPYDEMDDPLVDPEAGEVPPIPPTFAREVARSDREWDNSKTSFRLPPINLERPVAALRKSIAQFRNMGPFGLNTVPEEDEKSSAKRSSGANTHKRGTVRSITSMFFRSSRQFFGNRGSTATNRISQMSTGSGYGEGLFNRQSVLSTPESDLVSPRTSMDPNRDTFPLATPLSYPNPAYISPTSTLKPRLVDVKNGGTQFTYLGPPAETRNTFPEPPPSPSGSDISSQSSVGSVPVDPVSPKSASSTRLSHRSL